jgi:hypothetical protein
MAELRRVSGRLAHFPGSLGTHYLCPYCWMVDRKAAVMLADSADAAEESVRCRDCERELRAV